MREELIEFKPDVNRQLATNMLAMQEHNKKINEMATQIDDTETWSAEANAALQQTIQGQQKLEDKLNDIESRARRNNLRIHGVPEDAERGSVMEFVEEMLRAELKLNDDVDLQIQRAHRALAPKLASEVYYHSFSAIQHRGDGYPKSMATENHNGRETDVF